MGEFSGTKETFDALAVTDDGLLSFLGAQPMSDQPGFDGHLVPFYCLADRGCFFVPGSLKRTAKEQLGNAQVLYQHFRDVPIGRHTAAAEDDKGFRISAAINEGTQAGADAMSNLRFGVPMGLSIGFDTISDRSGNEADDKLLNRKTADTLLLETIPINELRAITAARWWESSLVTWPSIGNAKPDQIRSANGPNLSFADQFSYLLDALKSGRLTADETGFVEQIVAAFGARTGTGLDHATPALELRHGIVDIAAVQARLAALMATHEVAA